MYIFVVYKINSTQFNSYIHIYLAILVNSKQTIKNVLLIYFELS